MRTLLRIDRWALACLAIAATGIGCDDQTKTSGTSTGVARSVSAPAIPPAEFDKGPAEPGEATTPKAATAGRKIIYNAQVQLVTEDLNALEGALNRLVSAGKAYVADSDRSGAAGTTRHGNWKIRVPVDGYDAFLKGAVALGELVSVKADSQDVSEEFFDLEARETAKKVEEARLLKHLTDSTGKLEEILAVERELTRVRSEIERMQGRLRALANLTSLATVTITATEIKGYAPPQAPTLATRVGRTFFASLGTLRQFGEAALLAAAAVAPWLPLILVGLAIAFWANRRFAGASGRPQP